MWNKRFDERMIHATYKVGPTSYRCGLIGLFLSLRRNMGEHLSRHFGSLFVRSLVLMQGPSKMVKWNLE